MTSQPPIPPTDKLLDTSHSDSAPSADSADEGLVIHGAEVIDATQVDPDAIDAPEATDAPTQ